MLPLRPRPNPAGHRPVEVRVAQVLVGERRDRRRRSGGAALARLAARRPRLEDPDPPVDVDPRRLGAGSPRPAASRRRRPRTRRRAAGSGRPPPASTSAPSSASPAPPPRRRRLVAETGVDARTRRDTSTPPTGRACALARMSAFGSIPITEPAHRDAQRTRQPGAAPEVDDRRLVRIRVLREQWRRARSRRRGSVRVVQVGEPAEPLQVPASPPRRPSPDGTSARQMRAAKSSGVVSTRTTSRARSRS